MGKFVSYISLLVAVMIWGSTFFIMKEVVAELEPTLFLALRFIIAGVMLIPFLIWKRVKTLTHAKNGILLGVLFCVVYLTQSIGVQYTSASNSGFITGTFILFVPFFGKILLDRNPKFEEIVAITLSLVGLYFVTGGINSLNTGDFITLLTALSLGVYISLAEKLLKNGSDPWLLNFQQFMITGTFCFLIFSSLGGSYPSISTTSFIWILYLSVFGSVIAYSLQFIAQKNLSGTHVSLMLSLEPLCAFLFILVLGGESLIGYKLFGGCLIVGSIALPDVLKFLRKNPSYSFKIQ